MLCFLFPAIANCIKERVFRRAAEQLGGPLDIFVVNSFGSLAQVGAGVGTALARPAYPRAPIRGGRRTAFQFSVPTLACSQSFAPSSLPIHSRHATHLRKRSLCCSSFRSPLLPPFDTPTPPFDT